MYVDWSEATLQRSGSGWGYQLTVPIEASWHEAMAFGDVASGLPDKVAAVEEFSWRSARADDTYNLTVSGAEDLPDHLDAIATAVNLAAEMCAPKAQAERDRDRRVEDAFEAWVARRR